MKAFIWDLFAWIGISTVLFRILWQIKWGRKLKQVEAYMAVSKRERALYEKWREVDLDKASKHINYALEASKKATDIFDSMEKK